jgi:ABC-2 type transport system ATP-binding protein
VAAAGVLVAGAVAGWRIGDDAPRPRAEPQRIQVVDGPKDDQHVTLDATFFPPVEGGRAPAILLAHGLGGSKDDTRAEAMELARAGYAVLTWSARGSGNSTGEIALDSPDYEVKDTRQLIDWLAHRPEVQLDRPGDPRVGMAGDSYGGGISLMTAAYDSRVDAIVPRITWYDLADAIFPGGVFKKLWAGILFANNENGRAPTPCGRFLPSLCAMYQKVAETGRPTDEAIRTLRRSSPSSVPGRIKVPTLLIQGQSDSLFPLDQADANARAVSGAPVSVVWFQGGHDGGDQETSRVRALTRDWFDRWLGHRGAGGGPPTGGRNQHVTSPAFTVTRTAGIDSSTQRPVVREATAGRYPGLSAPGRTIALAGREQTVQNPAGGTPASISALPGLGSLSALGDLGAGGLSSGLPRDVPGQTATFDTAPLTTSLQLTGAATVRVRVSGGPATLFAKLYDVPPDGRGGDGPDAGTPARALATPVRADGDTEITLPAMDYRFARGHRVRLVLSTTDMGFATPAQPASYQIAVTSGLTVPAVPGLHTPQQPPPWWTWALPVGAVLLALAIVAGRRRTPDSYDPALAEVPLVITGLTKAYGGGDDGQRAVDELSFRVEKGQVLGLLGPNGAGKTTTLRMLMGLIHPDAGEIRIFGHRVRPGAPVLARLGSFVEGPGFLPHLSGRDNLELYWRATGRALADAHMDEVLEIADLGTALDRPVRTYSHGMRQRLAIAQAMLGMPDLLVLDEPTNGLDPPQIREMREVLVRYGEAGRTVIVSSHLLAEVEQTCTHVVVMFRGQRVGGGPVAEVIGAEGRLEDAFLAIIAEGS